MPILNYRTEISAETTVAEIQKKLVKAGAERIMLDFANGQPIAVVFQLQGRPFRLPCRHEAVLEVMKRDQKVARYLVKPEHALRVAWRILKDWIEAQLALIETDMVKVDEVFLPYLLMNNRGETVYDVYLRNDRMLPMKQDD